MRKMRHAAVRLMPTPPAFSDSRKTDGELWSVSENASIAAVRCLLVIVPSRRTKWNPLFLAIYSDKTQSALHETVCHTTHRQTLRPVGVTQATDWALKPPTLTALYQPRTAAINWKNRMISARYISTHQWLVTNQFATNWLVVKHLILILIN